MLPQESIIFFDFDDTILPTTAIDADPRLDFAHLAPCFGDDPLMPADPAGVPGQGPLLRDLLLEHARTVGALLRQASDLARVVIVTLSQRGWVDTAIHNFLPPLEGLLEELGIRVLYARESLSRRRRRAAAVEDGVDCNVVMKARAISRALRSFYGRPGRNTGRSWKNIISIGDSAVEIHALNEVAMARRQLDVRGVDKPFRTKVVKLHARPPFDVLTLELQAMLAWCWRVVHHDGDFAVDLSGDEDPVLAGLDALLSGAAV